MEYLVRWKFGPHSLTNHRDVETSWYQQIHPDKKTAVDHYASLLYHSSPSMAMTTEIFQLVQLVPGEPEVPEIVLEEPTVVIVEQSDTDKNKHHPRFEYNGFEDRNKQIMKLHKKGHTRREIATEMDLSYQTVYSVVRRLEE